MPTLFQGEPSHWQALYAPRFIFGLQTFRNPLRSPAGMIYADYYKIGGIDALIAGENVELSDRLTYIRRPGNTAGLSPYISSDNVPGIIDAFYSFEEIDSDIRVLADTSTDTPSVYLIGGVNSGAAQGSNGIVPIFTKNTNAGQAYFQGVGNTLYIADGVEVVKWIDTGVGHTGNSLSEITATALTSNVATITAANNFIAGQTVVISGTSNGSGIFNGTFIIATANGAQFTFSFTHGDVVSAGDAGFASAVWNSGIVAPTLAPTVTPVASGSSAVAWQASTIFSTMGIINDSTTNSLQQLISVNVSGTNTTQFGTSGNGEPAWDQTPGNTTSDGTITWTNWGPIPAWAAHTVYNNASIGGTLANPSQIYDPTTKTLQLNIAAGNAQATSGSTKPNFVAVQGANLHDPLGGNTPPNVKWFTMFPAPGRWKPSTAYGPFLGHDLASTAVIEPSSLPAGPNQTVYLQISNGGTSGSSGTSPQFSATLGTTVSDNDLIWQSLGSNAWTASTVYTPWTGFPGPFSAIVDNNTPAMVQVCTSGSGNFTSGVTEPRKAWQANHAYSNGNTIADSNGNLQTVTSAGTSGVSKTLTTSVISGKVATYTTSASHGAAAGQFATVTGSTHNGAFNVRNAIIASVPSATTFTINLAHDDIGSAADTGNVRFGPTWNAVNGGTTTDGGVTWTCGGVATPAGWGTQYGQTVTDGSGSNGVVWTCVGPAETWQSSTIYHLPTTGFIPPNGGEPFGGSEVISGTAPNQSVQAVTVSGKSAASPTPTFSTTQGNFVYDPAAGGAGSITWINASQFSQFSLAFNTGYTYAYSYKARTPTDQYSPISVGGQGIQPPGFFIGSPNGSFVGGLPVPSGSGDGSVSTASPSTTISGQNSGAVITVTGVGSSDPQVDTIVLFRTLDGGATMFELTEFPNPGGNATWTFQDFLPDIATAANGQSFPGLNTLVLAPTSHSNDPIPSNAINLVQYFQRIFFSVGSTVFATRGPDIGGASQPPGNGFTAAFPGNFWQFPFPVTRMVPHPSGLLVFTTSDLFIITGGPNIATMFAIPYIKKLGLTSYNSLADSNGIIYLFTADSQVISLDPNMGQHKIGKPIGDQFANFSSGGGVAPGAAFGVSGILGPIGSGGGTPPVGVAMSNSIGDYMVAAVQFNTGGGTPAISDTGNNTWVPILVTAGYGMWYSVAATANTTVTITGAGSATQFFSYYMNVRPTLIGLTSFLTAAHSGTGTVADASIGSLTPNPINIANVSVDWNVGVIAFNGSISSLMVAFPGSSNPVLINPGTNPNWSFRAGSGAANQLIQITAYIGNASPFSVPPYVTYHIQGFEDDALYVGDGSTGWFRGTPSLSPDAAISGPVWSPKANIIGGIRALASLTIAPGKQALLMGANSPNQPVLVRDSTYKTFSDNGSAYPSNMTFGSMVLASPGQLAELGFITCEFEKVGSSPQISVMLDEIADSVMSIVSATQSGSDTTYVYSLTSGSAVVAGSGVTISDMDDAGNNGTFEVISVTPNSFTVENTSGVTASSQSGQGTLFESLNGYTGSGTGLPIQDPPTIYGTQFEAASIFANRYYFGQSVNGVAPPQGTACRTMQMKIDFGGTDEVQNEILSVTLFGAHHNEQ